MDDKLQKVDWITILKETSSYFEYISRSLSESLGLGRFSLSNIFLPKVHFSY